MFGNRHPHNATSLLPDAVCRQGWKAHKQLQGASKVRRVGCAPPRQREAIHELQRPVRVLLIDVLDEGKTLVTRLHRVLQRRAAEGCCDGC